MSAPGGASVSLHHAAAIAVAALAIAVASPTLAASPRVDNPAVDRVLVVKHTHRLYLLHKQQVIRSYQVWLGRQPKGTKTREGDGRTPEGVYRLDGRNSNSRFHLALHISYPGPEDIERAQRLGVSPGGAIMVHGLPKGFEHLDPARFHDDWTEGCIALSNRAVEEIWSLVADDTPIEIRP